MSEKKYSQFLNDPKVKQIFRDQMAGYKILNELTLQEQRMNLPKMTVQESKEIYEGLLMVWDQSQKQNPDMGDLDRLRLQELIERRRMLDKIASGLAKT